MEVFVAGAHGKTGTLIVEQLLGGGHGVRALLREDGQRDDLRDGASAVIGSLPGDVDASWLDGVEAVVFAAAGPSGHEDEVDHRGAEALARAAAAAGVGHYVLVSALGAHEPTAWGPTYEAYLRAKADGEAAVRESGVPYTILRPGSLSVAAATGLVTLRRDPGGAGSLPRADLAAAVVAVVGRGPLADTFEVVGGGSAVAEAVAAL